MGGPGMGGMGPMGPMGGMGGGPQQQMMMGPGGNWRGPGGHSLGAPWVPWGLET